MVERVDKGANLQLARFQATDDRYRPNGGYVARSCGIEYRLFRWHWGGNVRAEARTRSSGLAPFFDAL